MTSGSPKASPGERAEQFLLANAAHRLVPLQGTGALASWASAGPTTSSWGGTAHAVGGKPVFPPTCSKLEHPQNGSQMAPTFKAHRVSYVVGSFIFIRLDKKTASNKMIADRQNKTWKRHEYERRRKQRVKIEGQGEKTKNSGIVFLFLFRNLPQVSKQPLSNFAF